MNLRAPRSVVSSALAAPACAGENPAPRRVGTADSAATATRIYATEGDLDLSLRDARHLRGAGRRPRPHPPRHRQSLPGERLQLHPRRPLRRGAHHQRAPARGRPPRGLRAQYRALGPAALRRHQHLHGLPQPVHRPRRDLAALLRFPRVERRSSSTRRSSRTTSSTASTTSSYRGSVDALATRLTVTAPDGAPTVSRVDADTFDLDWSVRRSAGRHRPAHALAHLHRGAEQRHHRQEDGAPRRPRGRPPAHLGRRLRGLARARASPTSTPAITGSPPGTTDFSACGSYREVAELPLRRPCATCSRSPSSLTPLDASSPGAGARLVATMESRPAAHLVRSHPSRPSTPRTCPDAPGDHRSPWWRRSRTTDQNQPPAEDGTFTDRAGLCRAPSSPAR